MRGAGGRAIELRAYKVWEHAASIRKPTLEHLPERAVRFCGPAVTATLLGPWLYAGFDFDAFVNVADEWKVEPQEPLQPVPMEGAFALAYGQQDQRTISVFTGLVFQPPEGHALLIRNPSNLGYDRPWRIQEAVIEDWCTVPIWLRLKLEYGQVCRIRKDTPLAQLTVLPVAALKQPGFEVGESVPEDVQRFIAGYYDLKRSGRPKNSRCYHEARAAVRSGTCPFVAGGGRHD